MIFIPTDYQIALKNLKESKRKFEATLKTLDVTYEAICEAMYHGRKEQILIDKIKHINALLFNQKVEVVRCQHRLNNIVKRKEKKYE